MLSLLLASFRIRLPKSAQIQRLNRNSLVPLCNDITTIDKVPVNIMANSHTLFLAPSNSTVQAINDFVTHIEKHAIIAKVINAFKSPVNIYKDMTVIITKNRYNFFTYFTLWQDVY